MTTIAEKRTVNNQSKAKNVNHKYDLKPINAEGTFLYVPVSQIDISPLNYRRVFDPQALQDFAEELCQHGIISPLTLRKKPSGRFELVVGERRYRASKIGKLKTVPAMIKMLTDEQVIEIMLAENLQREDPHPLHEAQGIARMHKSGKSIEDIAARLGKSKTFVYCRLKWSELIIPIQEMFLANKLSIQEATELSVLATESQQEFFDQYCNAWEKDTFKFSNLRHAISRFKYDLKNAPFDTKDKTLVPEAGACTKCPFNSATCKTLFPEMAKEAVCTHKVCYKSKCISHLERSIRNAITEHKPDALISYGNFTEESQMVIDSLPEANALPEHSYYDISVYRAPAVPDKEEYLDYIENEDGELDEESYNCALEEYKAELVEYEALISTGALLKGLCVVNDRTKIVFFSPERKAESKSVTAKEVQEAIKNGSVTPELLAQEINRIEVRETRAKELDAEKIQKQIYDCFKEELAGEHYSPSLNNSDIIAAGLLIFQSLDWNMRNTVIKTLFPETDIYDNGEFHRALSCFTDAKYAHLIRLALCGRSTSSMPLQMDGFMLYRLAKDAGFDVTTIERQQQEKATEREKKVKQRIEELENKIEKLKSAA